MRIKIFQMESSERTYGKKFFEIPKEGVDPSLYKHVYYGDVDAENLEDVYRLFNDNRPCTFQGHSLSMSDVVEVCNENEDLVTSNGSYFVQNFGFEKIDFDASKAQDMEGMRVVYVTPNNTPLDIRIGTDLRDLQNAVGGLIQPINNDDGTVIIGNDEAKLIGMKGNRHLDYGGVIAEPFFVCGDAGEEFRSLTDEEAEKYMQKYAVPRINAKIDNLVNNDTNLRAFASVTVGNAVAIHGLRVMDSKKGLFVSMPSYSYEDRNGETKYADYAHPISKEARDAINTKVLDAYKQALEETESEDENSEYGDDYGENEDEDAEYGSEDYDGEPDEAQGFRPRM